MKKFILQRVVFTLPIFLMGAVFLVINSDGAASGQAGDDAYPPPEQQLPVPTVRSELIAYPPPVTDDSTAPGIPGEVEVSEAARGAIDYISQHYNIPKNF